MGEVPLGSGGLTKENLMSSELWNYRTDLVGGVDVIVGFDVEASDGHIGKIDVASTVADRQSIVVDTGFWIFGKKRMIPAGMVENINYDDHKVFVAMTKDQVKGAPEHVEDDHFAPEFDRLQPYNDYYRPFS